MSIIENSILTAILGDCMGIPCEFPKKLVSIDDTDSILSSYKKRIGGRYFPTILNCQKGSYSDDTQMMLMTLRSLQCKDFVGAMITELKAFMAYECGSGRATKASCKAWEKDTYPWHIVDGYYNFGGNGVVMRVLPHAFQEDSIDTIMTDVFLNGILTHGSPVALVGAQLYVYYIWCKINNYPSNIVESRTIWSKLHDTQVEDYPLIKSWWDAIPDKSGYIHEWSEVSWKLIDLYKNVSRDYATVLSEVPVCGSEKGAGSWCSIGAIILSECKDIDPISLMKRVATLEDADTDTLGCILGGILGINGGVSERLFDDIKDIDYIYSEIEFFQKSRHCIDVDFLTKKGLKDKIRKLNVGDSIFVSPFGKVTLVEIEELESLSDSVRSYLYKYTTQIGQTLTALQFRKC